VNAGMRKISGFSSRILMVFDLNFALRGVDWRPQNLGVA
jgi:hypothetical protein